MRGLKRFVNFRRNTHQRSHLLQMRGLKPIQVRMLVLWVLVASFTDAWIETLCPFTPNIRRAVASFTDAWIETYLNINSIVYLQSHLLQMRGLKQTRIF